MKKIWLNSLSTMVIVILATILSMPSYTQAMGVGGGPSSGYAIGERAFIGVLLTLVVIVVILLIFREIICWYWKMNEVVSLLTDIRELLRTTQKSEEPLTTSAFTMGSTQTATNKFEPSKSGSSEELQKLKSSAGEDAVTIPYTTQNEWICVCGTHNPLDSTKKIQNCSNCQRNRDFVLSEYGKKE